MSVETGSSTSTVDVYVPLRNEGTDVLRPTVFVPEYHPDGTVRLAVMPPRRTITTQVRNRPKEP